MEWSDESIAVNSENTNSSVIMLSWTDARIWAGRSVIFSKDDDGVQARVVS